ncbi:arylamine N-acetyltransferase [Staphylococcus equorum]|uniref:Arylamine N-acetyltransferase n=1 Tax=Staphylococcus equorum TaxID=246432 RepID=A0A9X4LBU0_9STAP|nr:arylamine N-acetyltransferase [Staphylococcus equorum]MDG0842239.1 arylamine N-acetyltransferase [Staphylococcus equorum]MDG0857710.1 arylamine N-acetyltransferase [Staphylococcus equorum]
MTNFKPLEAYLNINVNYYTKTDLETLNHYIHQYVLHVPFENIDVQNKQPIALDDESMLRKIIQEHRGGFCYEQNRLFYSFLRGKGFDVYMISATISTGEGWAMEGSHMALVVRLNHHKYLVDVGYADVPKKAIPLIKDQNEVIDVNGTYRVIHIDAYTIEMQKYKKDDWETQYRAIDTSKTLKDFAAGIEFNQHHPDSIFVRKLLVSKAKTYGRVTLSNAHLTMTNEEGVQKFPVTQNNYQTLLSDYFGIKDIQIQTFKKY